MKKNKVDILELFTSAKQKQEFLNVSAPMVRYSKLEFRRLLRKYNVNLCFTPMIVAKSFHESAEARKVEFTTDIEDTPLIAQFAASNSYDLCKSTELIIPYVDGIDINCGCPQKWAIASGYGCALLKEPELINDMVKSIKRLPINNLENGCSLSIKMRLLQKDIKYTIDLCRKFQSLGLTFLTVHGRTPWQKSSELVDINALTEIKKSLDIPLICNGDIRTLNDANIMHEKTNCDGIMSARGLLTNPTLFTGTSKTPLSCIQDWINLTAISNDNITFQCLHHHLTFMIEKFLKRKQRVVFNNFTKKEQILEFLYEQFNIKPIYDENYHKSLLNSYINNIDTLYMNNEIKNCYDICANKSSSSSLWNKSIMDGKYFNEFKVNTTINHNVDDDYDNNDLLNYMEDIKLFDF